MIKLSVKANAVTSLTDARYFSARGVDWIGFQMEPGSERYVSPDEVQAIKNWVDGVKIVGEFDLTPISEIIAISKEVNLDAVQVGQFADKDELMRLKGTPVIKEVVILENMEEAEVLEHFLDYSPFCEYFLLDLVKSGINWEEIQLNRPLPIKLYQSLCKHNKVLLNIPFQPATLPAIVHSLQPYGICIAGGDEEKTGIKSFEQLDELFDLFQMV